MRVVETANQETAGTTTINAKFTWTTEEVKKAMDEAYFELSDEHLDDSYREITKNNEEESGDGAGKPGPEGSEGGGRPGKGGTTNADGSNRTSKC